MMRTLRNALILLTLLAVSASAQFPPFSLRPLITGITGSQQLRAPYILSKSAIPFVHASTGSFGNNGALTLGTALPLTYSGGAWTWVPAGAVAAGVPAAASWIWCVYSSTTLATCYNSTYTAGTPTIGTQTAYATTGPGAFTGDVTEAPGPTITVPANAIGLNGVVRIWFLAGATNSANDKRVRVRYSGASGTQMSAVNLANNVSYNGFTHFINRGVASSQVLIQNSLNGGIGVGTSANGVATVDSSVSTTAVLGISKTTATDNAILDAYYIEIMSDGT
jgi:hypothetical protein